MKSPISCLHQSPAKYSSRLSKQILHRAIDPCRQCNSVFSRRGRSRSQKKSGKKEVYEPISMQNSLIPFPPLKPDKPANPENQASPTPLLTLWNSLFQEPKKFRSDKVLSYFKPMLATLEEDPFILAPEEAINQKLKKWEKCLVAYVVGKRPHFLALKTGLEAQWKLKNKFKMNAIEGDPFQNA